MRDLVKGHGKPVFFLYTAITIGYSKYYMGMNVKLCLRPLKVAILLLCALLCFLPQGRAQEIKALPVPVVQEEKLPILGKAPVIVELFSSQACVFCPKADQLFADLITQDNVIGLACHVDYFDVKKGSLAKEFCTKRQSWYMEKLFAGPNYTPQMVINGAVDVIGYKFDEVVKALQKALYSEILPLEIAESDAKGTYKVTLPIKDLAKPENYKLWLALYDQPHNLTIADGLNRGKKATYYNIVSELGSTGNVEEDVFVTPPLKSQHAGFVVILQDMESGKIYAVGRHKSG